jgi:STE24 endopeptidase
MEGPIQINLFLTVFLIVFGIRSVLQVVLNRLNIQHLNRSGGEVPSVFKDLVDQEKLARISSYTADSARFRLISSLFGQSLVLVILLSGVLPLLVKSLSLWVSNPIGRGLIFFAALSIIFTLPQIPFSLYETFVIEERHGFNTRDLKIWILDLVKGTVISAVLGGFVLGLLLVLINSLRQTWWIWAWIALATLQGLIIWLYPVLIAPWFNRFEPIRKEALEHRIRDLMGKAGLAVQGVFQMDAGKRTRHTNAYFTGLGRTKRVVLFDTLLDSHVENEILAILSHEAGHWKRRHIVKQLLIVEIASLFGLFVTAKLLDWDPLYQAFGFDEPIPFVGLFLVGTVLSLGGFFSRPLDSAISRRFERQADDMTFELMGTTEFLGSALRKLALDNLANLNPHPLYAWFYYSHPPIAERIERLDRMEKDRTFHEAEPAAI